MAWKSILLIPFETIFCSFVRPRVHSSAMDGSGNGSNGAETPSVQVTPDGSLSSLGNIEGEFSDVKIVLSETDSEDYCSKPKWKVKITDYFEGVGQSKSTITSYFQRPRQDGSSTDFEVKGNNAVEKPSAAPKQSRKVPTQRTHFAKRWRCWTS